MYGRFDLESFLGILDRSSHMEVRLYFHQLFCGIKKCLMALRCSEAIPNILNDVFSLFLVYF